MTFIAGYIYNDSVHVIADSAETIYRGTLIRIPENLEPLYSSLGESPHITDEQIVVESALKIYSIENKILITFAGTVIEGVKSVEDILMHYKSEVKFSNFLIKYFQDSHLMNTEYIVAFFEEGIPCLYFKRPNGESKLLKGGKCIVVGGTNVGNISLSIESTLERAFRFGYSSQETLILIITTLQSMTMHLQTIRVTVGGYNVGVGGHYNGAIVHCNGIEWAKDTAHIFYSARSWSRGDKWFMFRFNRENSTFIVGDRLKRLFTTELQVDRQSIIAKWGDDLVELAMKCITDFVTFISYDRRNVLVISNDNKKTTQLKIQSGKIEVPQGSEIAKHLFAYTSEQRDGPQSGFDIYTNF